MLQRTMFRRIILPAIILQSVLIGGGYSTGREIVEYAGKYGTVGWVSLITVFLGFTVISILTFELARVTKAYDYKSWIQEIIGPIWPLFDLLLVAMYMVVLAVMISAVDNVLGQTLGTPTPIAIMVTLTVVVVLAFLGERVIERFKTAGTGLLFFAYFLFAFLILGSPYDAASSEMLNSPDFPTGISVSNAIIAGIIYISYNLLVFPTVLFTLHRQQSRRDTMLSGVTAGLFMTVPFMLTFLCLMKFYPSPEIFDSEVPWLSMLRRDTGVGAIALYGVVVSWTLLETSVGVINTIVGRIERSIAPGDGSPTESRIPPTTKSGIALAILIAAMLLSKIGIIDLVAKGYTLLAYGFMILFAIPLLTIGLHKILREKPL